MMFTSRARRTSIRAVLATAVALALAVATGGAPSHADSGPKSWRCDAVALGLGKDRVELAPVDPAERAPDGRAITPRPDRRGRWVPVILVHGWTSQATHPSADGHAGAFSSRIDLTANRLGNATSGRSLVGQLQGLPGAAVFTFDYHPYSGRWVTDSHQGPALGKVIDCLAQASGEKVIVVGHSMGGLIARFAAATPNRTTRISRIVTFGTPNEGSVAALLAATAVELTAATSRVLTVLRLILSACGSATSNAMESGTLCDLVPVVAAFTGDAGKALRYGSAELRALPRTPRGITVEALAGDTVMSLPSAGWFRAPWDTTDVGIGDVVVGKHSAVAGATAVNDITCHYQLNPQRGATDLLTLRLGLVTENDIAHSPLGTASGPCFHSALMRGMELTNQAMASVNEDIEGRFHPTAPDLTMTMDGVGPAQLGTPMTRFASSLGAKLAEPSGEQPCYTAAFEAMGNAFLLLTEGGPNGPAQVVEVSRERQRRADPTPRVATPKGIHLGSSTEQVLAAYPTAQREQHEYILGGEYLTVTNAEGTKAIVFETDEQGTVIVMRAGTIPQVQYVEHCA